MVSTQKSRGFTIVELLIVIVVIGILASISIVGYSGIQKRAHNTSTIQVVSTYYKALLAYSGSNGKYPTVPSEVTPGANDRVCLGTGYPDYRNGETDPGSDGVPDCGDPGNIAHTFEQFNTDLSGTVSIPAASTREITMPFGGGGKWVGVVFTRWGSFTVNGNANPYFLMYVLEGGDEDCKLNVVEEKTGSDPAPIGFPNMKTTTRKNSWSDSNATACVVALPNP